MIKNIEKLSYNIESFVCDYFIHRKESKTLKNWYLCQLTKSIKISKYIGASNFKFTINSLFHTTSENKHHPPKFSASQYIDRPRKEALVRSRRKQAAERLVIFLFFVLFV